MDKTHDADVDFLVKVVVIGNSGVGKSNLMTRFASDKFEENSLSTIGMSFATRVVNIDPDQEKQAFLPEQIQTHRKSFDDSEMDGPRDHGKKKRVKLQVWDTAGQERHRALMGQYYRGAAAAILVYDVTNKQSFQDVPRWLADLAKYVNIDDIVLLLVGNKCDLRQRAVSPDDGRKLAEQEGMFFIETSAKEATNVDRAFYIITRQLVLKSLGGKSVPSTKDRTKRASIMIDGEEIGGSEEDKSSNCGC